MPYCCQCGRAVGNSDTYCANCGALDVLGVMAMGPLTGDPRPVFDRTAALRTARTDSRMRDTAASLGAVVRAEDGTGVALARIEAHFARR